jgi:molecular chaperone GrpE
MTSETGKRASDETEIQGGQDAAGTAPDAATDDRPSSFALGDEAPFDGQAERVIALENENAELKDRMLRLAADMENLRRRTEREIRDARQYSVAGFAREMLSVADNLRRAIDAVPEEAKEAAGAGLMALIDGVEMTERALIASLEKHGVRKLTPAGQRFDPNFHQAMFEVPNTEIPNNTVVQVVQDGYAIGERVLRPAMVGVSKGGPKQAAGEKSPAEAGQGADDAA